MNTSDLATNDQPHRLVTVTMFGTVWHLFGSMGGRGRILRASSPLITLRFLSTWHRTAQVNSTGMGLRSGDYIPEIHSWLRFVHSLG